MPLGTELDAALADVLSMLKRAFPNGVSTTDYRPLLAALYEHVSDRNLANVISQLTHKDPDLVLNEIYEAVTSKKPKAQEIASLTRLLNHHGAPETLADN
ncbi:DUF3349 domain-containing protein [Pseudomonas protegens]|uniref:DUF3349 domain-containing protein n=1 Tax=Pseudomonas protegens TaxID=380021 RepID=UPI002A36D1AB|nr:DUF3349 domain-containing protein [Pseudomonas protegens]MDX9683017.1 DUF3349 domain-containing protein [Pseudomonas protegens]